VEGGGWWAGDGYALDWWDVDEEWRLMSSGGI
jgi:hypothetical protein